MGIYDLYSLQHDENIKIPSVRISNYAYMSKTLNDNAEGFLNIHIAQGRRNQYIWLKKKQI
jgi:hypothetical protein